MIDEEIVRRCKHVSTYQGRIKYSTVQYSTVQYSTVQYSTVQYSTVQYIPSQLSVAEHYLILSVVFERSLCDVFYRLAFY